MNTKIAVLLRNRYTVPTVVGVVSAASGFLTGYILGKRNGDVFEITQEALDEVVETQPSLTEFQRRKQEALNDPEFEALLDEEEEIARRHREASNSTLHIPMVVEEEVPELTEFQRRKQEALAEQMAILTQTDQRVSYHKVKDVDNVVEAPPATTERVLEVVHVPEETEEAVVEPVHIFAQKDPYWNFERELTTRTPTAPYVIHADEYITNESGFRQATVTYYQGDDIMTDQLDTPIYNYNQVFGELKFGHGSKDPNAVFIRNESMRQEWEVLLHTGHYAIEVQGLHADAVQDGELLHHQTPRKFRGE